MGRLILVSFAGGPGPLDRAWERRQRYLVKTARRHGIDACDTWNRARLVRTAFYRRNHSLLDRERGAGYWAWKPYVIRRALEAAAPGDHIVYWDVGRRHRRSTRVGHHFRGPIDALVRWCDEHGAGALPGSRVPQFGPQSRWTKRDCFVLMGCDEPRCWWAPQVEASFSIWRREERSLAFVSEWLRFATDPRIVTDDDNTCGLPNHPGFVEHRHDQSILTNLVVRHGWAVPICAAGYTKDLNLLTEALGRVSVRGPS